MIDAAQDAHRVGDDGVGRGGAEVVGRKALENLVCQAVGGGEREAERDVVGHAAAIQVGRRYALLRRERSNLSGGAVHEDDADVERAQHGDVQEEVCEILIRHDRPIDAEDEGLLAEARDVLQDAPQVGGFHVA